MHIVLRVVVCRKYRIFVLMSSICTKSSADALKIVKSTWHQCTDYTSLDTSKIDKQNSSPMILGVTIIAAVSFLFSLKKFKILSTSETSDNYRQKKRKKATKKPPNTQTRTRDFAKRQSKSYLGFLVSIQLCSFRIPWYGTLYYLLTGWVLVDIFVYLEEKKSSLFCVGGISCNGASFQSFLNIHNWKTKDKTLTLDCVLIFMNTTLIYIIFQKKRYN